MPNELEITYQGSGTLYAILRRQDDAKVWSVADQTFTTWTDASLDDYDIALSDRGGDLYQGDWPGDADAGRYRVFYYQQAGASPATADLILATSDVVWNGTMVTDTGGVSLDAGALTTLEKVKRHLRLTDDTHDELLAQLIHQASARIESLCGRRFAHQSHRERHRPGLAGYVVLRQYPATSITRVLAGESPALRIHCTGAPIRASVTVSEAALRLTSIDAQGQDSTYTFSFDTYASTGALADAVNALASWSATLVRNVPATDLTPAVIGECASQAAALLAAHEAVMPEAIDLGYGMLRLPLSMGRGPVLVEYEAGYEIIPRDVEQVAHELAASAFHLGKHDPNARRESLGDYSYWLTDAVALNRAQIDRLRLYMNVALAKGASHG